MNKDDWMVELGELVVRAAKIPLDIFIFYLYMRLINYFALVKLARMKANLVRLSTAKKAIIASAFILGVLGLYSLIMQIEYLVALIFLVDGTYADDLLSLGYSIERTIVWPIIDFLMNLAILYLLYSLGVRTLQQEKKQHQIFSPTINDDGKSRNLSQLIRHSDTGGEGENVVYFDYKVGQQVTDDTLQN